MVYMALGKPSEKEVAGNRETWTYRNYYSPEQKVFDEAGKGYAIDRVLTVRFSNGRVRTFQIINE